MQSYASCGSFHCGVDAFNGDVTFDDCHEDGGGTGRSGNALCGTDEFADGELIVCNDLQINESALTGEPVTEKSLEGGGDGAYPRNIILRSTMVMNGRGEFVVTAVCLIWMRLPKSSMWLRQSA